MKIYFAGSIRGGRDDRALYLELIRHLENHGTVLTEHVGDQDLEAFGEKHQSDQWIYERDMSWLRESDVIVAEVTTPSLGVGYEIGQAEGLGKPVLCLYRGEPGKRLSAMLSGNSKIQVAEYKSFDEAAVRIDEFISNLG